MKDNNTVLISGTLASGFSCIHEIYGEKFYLFDLRCVRASETQDIIKVIVSDRLIDVTKDYSNKYFEITGQFRSFNKQEEEKTKLILTVFVKNISVLDEKNVDRNLIELDGFLCKPTVYRKTPSDREICDLLLAVNRPYAKSDYIPCICWGRNAIFAENLAVGTRVKVSGRIQSRIYQKKVSENEYEERVAYEVSARTIEVLEGSNK